MTSTLLLVGGAIYVVLGTLHALYTLLDLNAPRRIVPDDPAVIRAMQNSRVRLAGTGTTMWRAWVGFNFSHSLGALLFGVLSIAAAGAAASSGVLLAFAFISLIYLTLAILYWFRIPIAGTALATACYLAAWLMSFA